MAQDNGGHIVIPEPDEGYKCAQIYFFDSLAPLTIDGAAADIAAQVDAFTAGSGEWLELYEPVWQQVVLLPRDAVFKIMAIITSYVKIARPTSTRKPIEVRRVPLPPAPM